MTIKTITFATLATIAISPLAHAGETINRVTTGWSNFNTDTKVRVYSVDSKTYDNWTRNIKIDAVGEEAGVNVKYHDGIVEGRAFATNVENPDPFVNIGEVYTSEYGKLTTKTKVIQDTHEYGGEHFTEYSLITNTGY